jgi:hypothetical protein
MAEQKEKTVQQKAWHEGLDHPLVPYIFTALISGGAAIRYAFRKGPYRAWYLGRSSKSWHAPVHSVRKAEMDLVRNKLSSLSGESYVVVRGPKGVGKTCIVDSMLEKRPGVLRFEVDAGTTRIDIMNEVFSLVTGNGRERARAKDVLKWYNRFYSKYPCVIALQAKERFPPSPYAEIGPAARDLGGLGFQVLVDASQHALADKKTERERYVEIGFMDQDSLFRIPEFQNLYEKLETCNLKEELWGIIGGSPMKVKNLVDECNGKEDIKEIVVDFLVNSVIEAHNSLREELKARPQLSAVFSKLQTQDFILNEELSLSATEVKSLRLVQDVFVPSNPTIGFSLRLGLEAVRDNLNAVRELKAVDDYLKAARKLLARELKAQDDNLKAERELKAVDDNLKAAREILARELEALDDNSEAAREVKAVDHNLKAARETILQKKFSIVKGMVC